MLVLVSRERNRLAVLAADDHFERDAAHAFVYWLPGVVAANVVGTTLGFRIPPGTLRWVTLALAFADGAGRRPRPDT